MEDSIISIRAVGDIMLGDSPVCFGFGVGTMISQHGPHFPFALVAEYLRAGDITVGNLEIAISAFDIATDSFKAIQYRAQPEAAQGLSTAGFDVLSVATNHTMQHGRRAFEDTLSVLSKHSIGFTGAEIPEKNVVNWLIVERKGLKLGFMAYNLRPQQYFIDDPLWVKPNIDTMLREVALLKRQVDHVILSLHWGDEFIDCPHPEQVRMAHALIDGGVSIILGHHPHILQGIEKYRGGVIAYSLGNFVFDKWQRRLRETIILDCLISSDGKIDYTMVPILINRFFQPEILGGTDAQQVLEKMAALSLKISLDPELQNTYDRELQHHLRRFRREVYWHYLTHLHKYNTRLLFANFVDAIKRRL